MTERERLIELIKEGNAKAGDHFRETTKKVLAEKGLFNSKTDYDRRNIYEIEADHLLSNGVIVPPCKVGDTVYVLIASQGYIDKSEITGLIFGRSHDTLQFLDGSIYTIWDKKYEEHFGKTIFFTKEEAEAALKGGVE